MDDPGMPTIHHSINQRSFKRSCPQHGNMHYSMSKRWTKITNSGTMLCKTSPLRFKTVPEHHKTQEELDTKMFSEFTSLVGMKLTDKEEIKKIKKKPAQP
jgi:hypothetical protein